MTIREYTKKQHKKLKQMTFREKAEYILEYYSLPILIVVVGTYLVISYIYAQVTRKDVALYSYLINVNLSDEVTEELETSFTDILELDPKKFETRVSRNLFLTYEQDNPDFEYTQASQQRLLAGIEAQQADVFLMNQEAFDAFSQNGFLLDLDTALAELDPEFHEQAAGSLRENILVTSENSAEVAKDPTIPYHEETETHVFGLEITDTPLIRASGLKGPFYAAIVENSPRKDRAVRFLRHLCEWSGPSADEPETAP